MIQKFPVFQKTGFSEFPDFQKMEFSKFSETQNFQKTEISSISSFSEFPENGNYLIITNQVISRPLEAI